MLLCQQFRNFCFIKIRGLKWFLFIGMASNFNHIKKYHHLRVPSKNNKTISQCLLALTFLSYERFAQADEGRGYYASAFGGVGRSASSAITQTTTVDADEFLLPVNVSGDTKKNTFGIAGVAAGHE